MLYYHKRRKVAYVIILHFADHWQRCGSSEFFFYCNCGQRQTPWGLEMAVELKGTYSNIVVPVRYRREPNLFLKAVTIQHAHQQLACVIVVDYWY